MNAPHTDTDAHKIATTQWEDTRVRVILATSWTQIKWLAMVNVLCLRACRHWNYISFCHSSLIQCKIGKKPNQLLKGTFIETERGTNNSLIFLTKHMSINYFTIDRGIWPFLLVYFKFWIMMFSPSEPGIKHLLFLGKIRYFRSNRWTFQPFPANLSTLSPSPVRQNIRTPDRRL